MIYIFCAYLIFVVTYSFVLDAQLNATKKIYMKNHIKWPLSGFLRYNLLFLSIDKLVESIDHPEIKKRWFSTRHMIRLFHKIQFMFLLLILISFIVEVFLK